MIFGPPLSPYGNRGPRAISDQAMRDRTIATFTFLGMLAALGAFVMIDAVMDWHIMTPDFSRPDAPTVQAAGSPS